jgi:hypothetical protein
VLLFCSFVCSFVFDDESAGLAAAIDPTGTKNRLSRSLSIQKRSFCQDTLGTDERKLVKRDTRFIYAGVFVTAGDIVIDSITSESFGRRRRELQVSEESWRKRAASLCPPCSDDVKERPFAKTGSGQPWRLSSRDEMRGDVLREQEQEEDIVLGRIVVGFRVVAPAAVELRATEMVEVRYHINVTFSQHSIA